MKATSCSAVEVECGVMLLPLRREKHMLKYALKLTQQQLDNPTSSVLIDTWHQHYVANQDRNLPFSAKINPSLLLLNLQIKPISIDPSIWKFFL